MTTKLFKVGDQVKLADGREATFNGEYRIRSHGYEAVFTINAPDGELDGFGLPKAALRDDGKPETVVLT